MFRTSALLVVAFLFLITTPVRGAEPLAPTAPALNPDILYDYDLYAAENEPRYGWFLVYRFSGGSTIESGPYSSYNQAAYRLWFNAEHNIYSNAVDADIVERRLPPAWQFVQRFDKFADAAAMAVLFDQFGVLTDIRRVSTLRISTSTPR